MESRLERILVPLDGTEESMAALDAIDPICRLWHPEVCLLGITSPECPPGPIKDSFLEAGRRLEARGLAASTVLRTGKPAAEILHYSRQERFDLIAMSTHVQGGLPRFLIGSVTEEVLRHAEIPILVCRPGATQGDPKRIVVALDGSERAEEILPHAAALAKKQGAVLDLVRVALPSVTPLGLGEIPLYIPSEDPTPYLQEVSGRLLAEGVECHATKLEGRAAAGILNHVTATGAGLLCMTTHGRSGVVRILMGSIAEEVLRHSPCPVLIRRMAHVPKSAAQTGGRP
jgi:nucleotide-binding universal stress UspA family protein